MTNLIIALIIGSAVGILSSLLANLFEKWLEQSPYYNDKLSPGWRLGLALIAFIIATVASLYWQMDESCKVSIQEISLSKSVLKANEVTTVSIRVDNPDGLPLLYDWKAVYGNMNRVQMLSPPKKSYVEI